MGEFQGREPCPARICDDIGGAFAMGAVGGGIWHSVKGFRNAPKGLNNRFFYAMDAVKARAPVTGGSFATWGALFATFDCTFAAVRHKEDPWNSIMSGAATGGVLAMRAGPRAAGKNALIGGVLLAAIEGLGIMITKMTAPAPPTAEDYARQGEADPLEPPTMPSFGGSLSDLFGSPSSSGSPAAAHSFDLGASAVDPNQGSTVTSHALPVTPEPPAPPQKAWYNPF